MRSLAISMELVAISLLVFEAAYLARQGEDFHFIAYIASAIAIGGSALWAKVLKR